ncbi:MAG: hypothetical protein M0T84_06935 [Betaproteobacteria bacterium]|nr:hypothetical protein [Betaproteobacteria bacterium]
MLQALDGDGKRAFMRAGAGHPTDSSSSRQDDKMRHVKTHKVEQLGMASVAFFWCFLMWFASAAFVPTIASEFGLGIKGVALLASSAIWTAPLARPLAGWAADKLGAPRAFVAILVVCGAMSIVSGYSHALAPMFGVSEYN